MMYRFRDGFSIPGVSAETANDELNRIYKDRAELTGTVLVEESRPKTAPLHNAFEWSDKKAAEQYRLQQARTLIRAVHVISDDDEKRSDPVFVHVRSSEQEREGAYHPVDVVVGRVDLFEQALDELERRVSSALSAVDSLKRAAEASPDADRLARVALAIRALQTASEAISSLH